MLVQPNRLMNPQKAGFSGGAPQMNGSIYASRTASMGDLLNIICFKAFRIPAGTTGTQWLWQFGSFLDEDSNLRHGCYAYLVKSGSNNKWSLTIGANKVNTFVPPDRYTFSEIFFARTQNGLDQFIIEQDTWYWIYFEANIEGRLNKGEVMYGINTGFGALSSVKIGNQVTSGNYTLLPVNTIVNTGGTGEASTGLGSDFFEAEGDLATEQVYSISSLAHYGGFFDNAYQGGGSPEITFVNSLGHIKQVADPLGYKSAIEAAYNARYYSHLGSTPQYTVSGGQLQTYRTPPLIAT